MYYCMTFVSRWLGWLIFIPRFVCNELQYMILAWFSFRATWRALLVYALRVIHLRLQRPMLYCLKAMVLPSRPRHKKIGGKTELKCCKVPK